MTQRATNRRIVLAARPKGLPAPTDFRLDETPIPEPADGQVLLRTLYLSLDPCMRNLMSEGGTAYAPAIPLGESIVGGTVSRVVSSRHPQFKEGDLVLASAGWQDYVLSDGTGLAPLGDLEHPSWALGILGMPAFTAHYGILDIAQPKPGETVVISAATGAVGAVAGQIARLQGARVIGIAGGEDKCRYAVNELGYDSCLDRHDPELANKLAAACPKGIDVYFEGVGGEVFDAVLPLLNLHARVPVCGLIAHYNDEASPLGRDRLPLTMTTVLQKRIRMQGFVILDHYGERFEVFRRDITRWIEEGKVKPREDIVDGLERAPAAFIGLLQGRNFGKLVVKVESS